MICEDPDLVRWHSGNIIMPNPSALKLKARGRARATIGARTPRPRDSEARALAFSLTRAPPPPPPPRAAQLSHYFKHSNFTSFQRQLNNFGFKWNWRAAPDCYKYFRADMVDQPVGAAHAAAARADRGREDGADPAANGAMPMIMGMGGVRMPIVVQQRFKLLFVEHNCMLAPRLAARRRPAAPRPPTPSSSLGPAMVASLLSSRRRHHPS